MKSRAILARQANGVADSVCNYILFNELKILFKSLFVGIKVRATKLACYSYLFYYGINKKQAVRAVSEAEKIAASGNLFLLFNVSLHCIRFSIYLLLILVFASANIILVLLMFSYF